MEGIDVEEYLFTFYNKAENKNQDPEKLMEKVLNKAIAFKRDWEKKLAAQIHDLPPYDTVFRGAKRHLKF